MLTPSVNSRNIGGDARSAARQLRQLLPLKAQAEYDSSPVTVAVARRAVTAADRIVAFSQTDFTEDLKSITVPVLVMHGDDDQIVPYEDSGPLSAKLVQNGTLMTYEGFPHGMPTTQADTISADLLAFIQS